MQTMLHAQPYDTSATGFYFSSFEEYQQKTENHVNAYGNAVEEYEIQFIDGDDCELFAATTANYSRLVVLINALSNYGLIPSNY